MGKSVVLFVGILFVSIFSQNTQRYSAEAKELMRELQLWYQQERMPLFIERLAESKAMEIEAFFSSDRFVETGAAYVTAIFSDPEIMELRRAVRDGALIEYNPNYPSVQKLHRLFKRLDPYLYQFLEQQFGR